MLHLTSWPCLRQALVPFISFVINIISSPAPWLLCFFNLTRQKNTHYRKNMTCWESFALVENQRFEASQINILEMSLCSKLHNIRSIPLKKIISVTSQSEESNNTACGIRKLPSGYRELRLLTIDACGLRLTKGTNYSQLLYH